MKFHSRYWDIVQIWFAEKLEFSIFNNTTESVAVAEILDQNGRLILRKNMVLQRGVNRVQIDNTNFLASGIYFLTIKNYQTIIQQKIYKQNR